MSEHTDAAERMKIVNKLCPLLKRGRTLPRACRALGVEYKTVETWQYRYPELDKKLVNAADFLLDKSIRDLKKQSTKGSTKASVELLQHSLKLIPNIDQTNLQHFAEKLLETLNALRPQDSDQVH